MPHLTHIQLSYTLVYVETLQLHAKNDVFGSISHEFSSTFALASIWRRNGRNEGALKSYAQKATIHHVYRASFHLHPEHRSCLKKPYYYNTPAHPNIDVPPGDTRLLPVNTTEMPGAMGTEPTQS